MEAIALDIAVTASALFLALLFVGMLIDILTKCRNEIGCPTQNAYSFLSKLDNIEFL